MREEDSAAGDGHFVSQRIAITAVMAGTMPEPLNVFDRRRLTAHERPGNRANLARGELPRETPLRSRNWQRLIGNGCWEEPARRVFHAGYCGWTVR